MNELDEEYLRRIHHASGVPRERAIDTTDAPPPISPSIAPGRPFQASIS